jgi:hypothetical protein
VQIVLAQQIAKCEEVENADKRLQPVPGDAAVQLSERCIKQTPAKRLSASRSAWVIIFPSQNPKADQTGQGKKEEAFLSTFF